MIRAALALLGCSLCALATAEAASYSVPAFTLKSNGLVAPTQAAAAGFSTLHSSFDFSTGTHVSTSGPWYNPGVWYQAAATGATAPTAANGVLNLPWSPGSSGVGVTVSTMAPNGTANTSWQTGYFEISMAFTQASGEWPALWMENNTATTSYVPTAGAHSYAEVDIFEGQSQLPTTIHTGAHTWVGAAGTQVVDTQKNSINGTPTKLSTENFANFNTYGLLWTPTQLSWYFNNRLIYNINTTTNPSVFPILNAGPMYLMMTNQIGANWTIGNSPPTSPVDMTVQWVRVWGP